MIYGPQHHQNITRLQPVKGDPTDDREEDRKHRRVSYKGRSWAEEEEGLPLQPTVTPPKNDGKTRVYADRALLERAQAFFTRLTTLEEKVAQLLFLETEAIYDSTLQREVELLIQTWQVGGILFRKGDYKRQGYLIQRFQEVTKTPVLVGGDFLHGLSFYLLGDRLPSEMTEQRFLDLGKAVMAQNRRLGVHVQFDRERETQILPMTEGQARAFRQGIRKAQGIVGKEKSEKPVVNFPISQKKEFMFDPSVLFSKQEVQETIGYKTLTFFDATDSLENLEKAYREYYDVFLLSNHNFVDALRAICKLVRSGKIREDEIDRRVIKVLIIKSLFFQP